MCIPPASPLFTTDKCSVSLVIGHTSLLVLIENVGEYHSDNLVGGKPTMLNNRSLNPLTYIALYVNCIYLYWK